MNAQDATDAAPPSLIGQFRRIGTQNLVRFALLTTFVWGAVSSFAVYQMIHERTKFFRFLVESNQEAIVSGQWRPFFEGLERDTGGDFTHVKICWGESSVKECGPRPRVSVFSMPVEAPLLNGGKPLVWVRAEISFRPAVVLSAAILLAFGVTGLAWMALMLGLKRDADRAGAGLARAMSDAVKEGDPEALRLLPEEVRPLGQALVRSIVDLQASKEREAAAKAALEISTQVAHDIRSPLSALQAGASHLSALPEGPRVLMRNAITRIHDIANDLHEKHRSSPAGQPVEPHLLSGLIDPVVSEKRLQYRSSSNVGIEAKLDADSYGLFARVQPAEFKRALSNLINNAIEAATAGPAQVRVGLAATDGGVRVTVQDSGRGIPPEVLAHLGERGESHGKAGGSGLGLYHARSSAESWGGRLEIASTSGQGTTVSILLPRATPPAWFVPALEIPGGGNVVILDDDPSIHGIWDSRLRPAGAAENRIAHTHSPAELRRWVQKHADRLERTVYLLDYELRGERESGLDLAQELGIGRKTILVTSRHEELEIRRRCAGLHVRLLPKALVAFIPIISTPESGIPEALSPSGSEARWDAILIDDDPLVRELWELAAKDAGKRLKTYLSGAAFLSDVARIDRDSVLYIDSKLEKEEPGEVLAERLRGLGFKTIFLATGRDAKSFADLPYLDGVVGKDPPWDAAA